MSWKTTQRPQLGSVSSAQLFGQASGGGGMRGRWENFAFGMGAGPGSDLLPGVYARTHYGDGFAAGPAAGAAYGSAAGFGSVNSGHGWGGGAGPAPGSVTGSWFAEEDFE